MKYFIDTEFIEGFHKPLFGKKRHFIDLISIAVVCEDGREYYAISNEFNPKDADKWVKDNVISKLPYKHANPSDPSISPRQKSEAALWKSNKQISQEVFEFCTGDSLTLEKAKFYSSDYSDRNIEFYAYYADYDWVVFCSLFGRMIDLPKGFPMYCRDLKQIMDEKSNKIDGLCGVSLGTTLSYWKDSPQYPTQENEHSALDDAKWNLNLYKFLIKV